MHEIVIVREQRAVVEIFAYGCACPSALTEALRLHCPNQTMSLGAIRLQQQQAAAAVRYRDQYKVSAEVRPQLQITQQE